MQKQNESNSIFKEIKDGISNRIASKFSINISEFVQNLKNEPIIKNNEVVPKISVIMPSFNQEEYIERSILSIVNQNYPNIELIIIDGGSTDNTVSIIKKYEKYITYWISEKDEGQSDALNKGFLKATGNIYCWLNSDDIYLPNVFKTVQETYLLSDEKENFVCFGEVLHVDEKEKVISYQIAFPHSISQFIYEGFITNCQALFWAKSIHEKIQGFDINLYNTMDYDLIIQLDKIVPLKNWIFIKTPFCGFRRYVGQKTGAIDRTRVNNEHRYIAEKYGYTNKYKFKGKIIRIYYRFRRVFFYLLRVIAG